MTGRAGLICLSSVVTAGMILRCDQIGCRSFWLDEAYSWTMATRFSLREIVLRTANDFHPPLYYIVLKCWIAIVDDSEVAQRSLSVLFDLLTMVCLYQFCCDAFAAKKGSCNDENVESRRSGGCLAAAFYAVNAIHIHWSVETRMYSMASFLAVLSSWLLVRSISSAERQWWFAYVLSVTSLLYTHNYGLFTVFGQACFVVALLGKNLVTQPWKRYDVTTRGSDLSNSLVSMVTAAIVICVSFLPWLSILFKQTEQAHAGYWIPKFEWWTIPKTWVDLLIHEDKPVEFRDSATTLTTSLVSLTVIFCFAWKVRTRGAVLLLAVIVSPIVCSAAISVIALPIITSKHYLTACGFFFCALAYVIRILLPRPVSNAAAGILIVNMLYVHLCYRDERQICENSGLRAAVLHLADHIQEGDSVAVANQGMLLTTRYYMSRMLRNSESKDVATAKLFYSVPLISWLGSALIDEKDRMSANELTLSNRKRVWVIGSTGDSPRGLDELPASTWAERSAVAFRSKYSFEGDIRLWLYMPRESS